MHRSPPIGKRVVVSKTLTPHISSSVRTVHTVKSNSSVAAAPVAHKRRMFSSVAPTIDPQKLRPKVKLDVTGRWHFDIEGDGGEFILRQDPVTCEVVGYLDAPNVCQIFGELRGVCECMWC